MSEQQQLLPQTETTPSLTELCTIANTKTLASTCSTSSSSSSSSSASELEGTSLAIFEKRYARTVVDSQTGVSRLETWAEACTRIADAVFPNNPDKAKHISEFIRRKYFIPNTPCFLGAGTKLGQLAACFVLPIVDDLGKDENGIFSTLRKAALIQQTGGGVGFDFSPLRPKDSLVRSSGGKSTGPVGFMKVFDAAFAMIAQGGTRRGANMAILRVDHPDIIEFINCKKGSESVLKNFNISVAVTNKFMQAFGLNKPYDLIDPQTQLPTGKTLVAGDVMNLIATNAWTNGEPGIFFVDTANNYNVVPNLYTIAATNPCGEQPLGPFECCNLGHINLAHPDFVESWKAGSLGIIDGIINDSVDFLDAMVDANKYIPGVPEIEMTAKKTRKIGLGITGLADFLIMNNLRYGSDESQEVVSGLMEYICYRAMFRSTQLAQIAKASFPEFPHSVFCTRPKFLRTKFRRTNLTHLEFGLGLTPERWDELFENIKLYGIRNACILTVAPTGTVSNVVAVEGYGCEPIYALSYTRKTQNGDIYSYISPLFAKAVSSYADFDEFKQCDRQKILDEIAQFGVLSKCPSVSLVPERLRNIFECTSNEITLREHLKIQATLQQWVDSGISKTCNCPESTSVAEIANSIYEAWILRLKGLTFYRTNSRNEVVLSMPVSAQQPKVALPSTTVAAAVKPSLQNGQPTASSSSQSQRPLGSSGLIALPNHVQGTTMHIKSPFGAMNITINHNKSGQPSECFVVIGKGGSDVSAVCEAMGRLISVILRIPTTLSGADLLSIVQDQLEDIGGRTSTRHTKDLRSIRSIPDGIACAIEIYLAERCAGDGVKEKEEKEAEQTASSDAPSLPQSGREGAATPTTTTKAGKHPVELCPTCGNATIVWSEGCIHCSNIDCGYSRC